MIIWFNLLLLSSGHWSLIETQESLEDCENIKIWYEQTAPGNYYCMPVKMEST
jgi:hypothetical protein